MNLTIDQMRAIVDGAPQPCPATHISTHCRGGITYIRGGNRNPQYYCESEAVWVCCEFWLPDFSLAEIRAAIASHDASINPQDAEAATVAVHDLAFKENVKRIALANGFKLKEQPDGSLDLNPYVYYFAAALLKDHGHD